MAETSTDVRSVTLSDGRRLAYAEWGDPSGKPIFYFHGTPSSRLEHHPDEDLTRARGARLITVDRPGYGLSDFQPSRNLLDWPGDVTQLADTLGINRFAVCGWSGGAPHAMSVAFKMPERVTQVALFSGASPFDIPGVTDGMMVAEQAEFALAGRLPWRVVHQAWQLIAWDFRRNPQAAYDSLLGMMQGVEREQFAAPAVRAVLQAAITEAYRQGGDAEAWEDRLLMAPWGFGPQDVEIAVHTWHGTGDTMAPVPMGRALQHSLRYGTTVWCEGEGHALWFSHWPEILDVLLA
jgi:pimeloyl-ACP methyl ester carboxylesterase